MNTAKETTPRYIRHWMQHSERAVMLASSPTEYKSTPTGVSSLVISLTNEVPFQNQNTLSSSTTTTRSNSLDGVIKRGCTQSLQTLTVSIYALFQKASCFQGGKK